jgi:hypothetical protein
VKVSEAGQGVADAEATLGERRCWWLVVNVTPVGLDGLCI